MSFKKAMPEQAHFKASLYGKPGTGKTFTALLWAEGLAESCGKRIAYIDTERGSDPYAIDNEYRKVHPKAFDFDALYTRSLSEALKAVRALDPKEHGVIVVDSISHLWSAAMDAYGGKRAGAEQDKIPMHAWASIKKPYKELIDLVAYGPYHGLILGRQKSIFETGDDGELRKVGDGMRAEGETQYEPMTCCQMTLSPQGVPLLFGEKDRWSVLSGRTIPNPNFSHIAPVLPMLGQTQASFDSDDERIAKDAEMLEENEAKQAAKANKSRELFAEIQGMVTAAGTIEELGEARAFANKRKRSLNSDHVNGLRLLFESRINAITKNAVGTL